MAFVDTFRKINPYFQAGWSVFCLACVITLYGLFTTFGGVTSPLAPEEERDPYYIGDNYKAWMDVHVMVYVGFGFLMVFLRAHSWTSLAFNWLTASWAFLCSGLWIGFWE